MQGIIITYTKKGFENAKKLQDILDAEVYFKIGGEEISELLRRKWSCINFILFISSTGIAVRMIAPFLKDKYTDPAVLCMDDEHKNVISLLSGHIGGANAICLRISEHLNATPIISTASDNRGLYPFDLYLKEKDYFYSDRKLLTKIMGAMVDGEEIALKKTRYFTYKYKNFVDFKNDCKYKIVETYENCLDISESDTLYIIPKVYYIGIGMRKGVKESDISKSLNSLLKKYNINYNSIKAFCTHKIKKEEEGLNNFIEKVKIPAYYFDSNELNSAEGVLYNSDFVKKTLGTSSVSEAAAILMSRKIIVRKEIINNITFSVSMEEIEND